MKMLMVLLMCLPLQALAMKVSNVEVPEKAHVGDVDLPLNGAGLRVKFTVKVYVVAMYFGEKKTTAAEAIAVPGNKRVALHVLRHLEAGEFMKAFIDAIRDNLPPEEFVKLSQRLIRFTQVFTAVGKVDNGDEIDLDYLPGKGTIVIVNGKEYGRIDGEDFYQGMMKIWLGEKPVSSEAKRGLLGGLR